ncbi:MAG: GTPase [Lawsonella clevelandensis]
MIVGYTNAGKSSLLEPDYRRWCARPRCALCDVGSHDSPCGAPADGHSVILTDTVGFVRYLPTQLVEAFRSTLEEVADADIIVHVVDGSDGFPLQQIESVNDVLADVVAEYGIDLPPTVIVINKCDAADPLTLAQLRSEIPDAVFVSAHTGEGMDGFLAALSRLLDERELPFTHLFPMIMESSSPGCTSMDGVNEEHGPMGRPSKPVFRAR